MTTSEWTAACLAEPRLQQFATMAEQAGANTRLLRRRAWWPSHRAWQQDCKSLVQEAGLDWPAVQQHLAGVHDAAYDARG